MTHPATRKSCGDGERDAGLLRYLRQRRARLGMEIGDRSGTGYSQGEMLTIRTLVAILRRRSAWKDLKSELNQNIRGFRRARRVSTS